MLGGDSLNRSAIACACDPSLRWASHESAMPCRATNMNSRCSASFERTISAGCRRKIRSREMVSSLVESRERQSRNWRTRDVSCVSVYSSARSANCEICLAHL